MKQTRVVKAKTAMSGLEEWPGLPCGFAHSDALQTGKTARRRELECAVRLSEDHAERKEHERQTPTTKKLRDLKSK